jgi:putative ABC transport system permease protein
VIATVAVGIALRQMRKNPLRTALTTLGVLIGVAAVIAMVVLGRGATADIQGQLAGLGQNLLFVMPGQPGHGGGPPVRGVAAPFAVADVTALARQVRGLRAVAGVTAAPVRVVVAGGNWSTTAIGVSHGYLTAMKWHIAAGRPLNEDDQRAGAAVCLLGETTRLELFGPGRGPDSVVGQTLRVGGAVVTVVGVLGKKGRAATGMDPDDTLLLPLAFVQRRLVGSDDVSSIVVSAADGEDTVRIQEDIVAVMRERRHRRPSDDADFAVRDMKEVERMVGSIIGTLSALLAAIAAISLVVGGIGIMNIMLVAVGERTREVGLRLALGARSRDVLLQFLVEASALSTLGGLAGIAVGLLGSLVATRRLGTPFVVDIVVIAVPVVFSGVIGVVFGFLPARQAARLRPIEALRHEA